MDPGELARLYVRASNYASRMSEVLAELGHTTSTHPDAPLLIERYKEYADIYNAILAQLLLQVPALGQMPEHESPPPDPYLTKPSTAQRFMQRVLRRR